MSNYDGLSREQLIELLDKRDRTKKLGLVWERDEIEADKAIDKNFVAATLDESLSDKPSPWGNLVIEGDNFDALRWLRMTYAGRIKCIYVDPPYNTGNRDWVYNDNYVDKDDRFRFSMWLEFLFQRFVLARELLTEDGVILVSINDDNRALLELMLDEALPGMRIGTLTWRNRKTTGTGHSGFLSQNHEHILVFGGPSFTFRGTDRNTANYSNTDDDPRGPWDSGPLTLGFNYLQRPNLYYSIKDPDTGVHYPCNPDRVWAYATVNRLKEGQRLQSRPMEEWIEEKQVLFPKKQRVETWNTIDELLKAIDCGEVPKSGRTPLLRRELPDLHQWVGRPVGFGTPRFKRFLKDVKNPTQPLSSWIVSKSEERPKTDENVLVAGTNDESSSEIRTIFGSKKFDYAKPASLIRGLIGQATQSDDTILDFFAGSATTAQAVMEINAQDGGNRSFIMASSIEATQEEPNKNICRDVTAERIRLLNASEDKKYDNLAAEFAYLKTREIDFEEIDYELHPSEAWNALEAIHKLPLTPYEVDTTWNEHQSESHTLVYVDQVNETVFQRIETLVETGNQVTVYSWSPGQLRDRLDGLDVELQSVRSTLVKRFQQ